MGGVPVTVNSIRRNLKGGDEPVRRITKPTHFVSIDLRDHVIFIILRETLK